MHDIIPHLDHGKREKRNRLAQLRRLARKRGFRILRDWGDGWSLIDIRVEPPRALLGLAHVEFEQIERAITTPLPLPVARYRKPVTPTIVEVGGAS